MKIVRLLLPIIIIFLLCSTTTIDKSDKLITIIDHTIIKNKIEQSNKIFEYVIVDKNFDNFEKQLIQEALFNWEYYSDDLAKFKIVNKFPDTIENEEGQLTKLLLIKKGNSYDPRTSALDILIGGDTLGFYDKYNDIPNIIIIADRIQFSEDFLGVIMHEVGHSLGLAHTAQEASLMYPYVSISCITQYDLKEFCNIYGCNSEEMNFCYFTDGPTCFTDENLEFKLK